MKSGIVDKIKENAVWGSLYAGVAVWGLLGVTSIVNDHIGQKEWEVTQKLISRAREVASGDDDLLSNSEKIQLLENLGLEKTLTPGENLYFVRNNPDFARSIHHPGDYAMVFAAYPEGLDYHEAYGGGPLVPKGRFIGNVHQETLREYLKSKEKVN